MNFFDFCSLGVDKISKFEATSRPALDKYVAFGGHILMIRFTTNDISVTILISVKNDSVFSVCALCSEYSVCENICFAWLGGSYAL